MCATTTATEAAGRPVALVTGAARRLGAAIATALHDAGHNLVIHYGRSADAARTLAGALDQRRPGSAIALGANLANLAEVAELAEGARAHWGRIDCLVNNASAFYPTPLAEVTESQWDDLLASNLKGPFFLSRALAADLSAAGGTIVNLADINGRIALKGYPAYSIAKAGTLMLTRVLARELAPAVRVNGIAPGAILWAEGAAEMGEAARRRLLDRIPLGLPGDPADIAALALLLATRPGYLSGQTIAVDGGLSLAGGYD